MARKSNGRPTYDEINSTRDRLVHTVFKALRKSGFIARANFMCCQGCAGAEISDMAKKRGHSPYVFWHRQDEDSAQRSNRWYLAYGHTNPKTTADQAIHVGEMVAVACRAAGLKVEWDGSNMTRILVTGLA